MTTGDLTNEIWDFEQFFRLTRDLVCIAGFDGKFKVLNRSWEHELGYSLNDLKSLPFLDFVHADDREKTKAEFSRMLAGEQTLHFENRYRCLDGSYKWLSWRSTTIADKGLVYAIARNITLEKDALKRIELTKLEKEIALKSEKAARQEAENQKERLFNLFTQIPAISTVLRGPEHVYEFVNPQYCELLGGRNPVGMKIKDVLPELDKEIFRILDDVYQTGTRHVSMERPIKADWTLEGRVTERYITFLCEPVRDFAGQVEGIWALAFDVTENKALQARLLFTERMAAVGTLAAGVAHEINNPLSYSLSNISLAAESLARSEHGDIKTLLSQAQEGILRVREIVKSLRVFSRSDDAKNETFEIPDVLMSALRMAKNEIRHRATLSLSIGSTPKVFGAPGKLVQVFLNLLINSAQAIEEGAAGDNVIWVRTQSDESNCAVIEIEDTGCGIPAENLKRIFDPFFTSKPIGAGNGLGLFICQGIIDGMGGEISVQSEMGRGTIFTVKIPAAPPSMSCAHNEVHEYPEAASERLRILIIDDEKPLCDVTQSILSRDHDVLTTTCAAEALTMIQSGCEFDVILCDLMMPDITGREFFGKLQNMGKGLERKVAFMTGGAFTLDCTDWLKSLPNRCLEKPFDTKELRAFVGSFSQNGAHR